MSKPKIGIVANRLVSDGNPLSGMYRASINNAYVDSLEKAGCIPVMLPVIDEPEDVADQIEGLSGIVLSGGYDVDPLLYGEQPTPMQGLTLTEVDNYNIWVIHEADKKGIPVLGICKGIQILNVAFGGTLYQDIEKQFGGDCFRHMQSAPGYNPTHFVTVEKGSFLSELLPERAKTNSFHHQCVKEPAPGFKITAKSDDGVPECIERQEGTFMMGVQWHPEMMATFDNKEMLGLFKGFAKLCMKDK